MLQCVPSGREMEIPGCPIMSMSLLYQKTENNVDWAIKMLYNCLLHVSFINPFLSGGHSDSEGQGTTYKKMQKKQGKK
jgi:hypothetical protein